MEARKDGAPHLSSAKKRVYRPRRKVKQEAPLVVNPDAYCLFCHLWISSAMRQALHVEYPAKDPEHPPEEWQYHPHCLKEARRKKPLFR